MRRFLPLLLIMACFAALFLSCYAPALVGDRQFGYRDAAHYYYPLYERVQQEWNAGRWPLWEREENAGMPLLGNPTAAVLYPGKLVFAILPYAWGSRVYVVAHTALAFVAMLVLMRSWRTSWVGSALSALSYSFGAPILFQSSNVIYLVGAAWLPLGAHAVDRWVRLGRRSGMVELTIVLAMQMLGGDPQSAYLLGWASGGYAAGIAWSRTRRLRPAIRESGDSGPTGSRLGWSVALALFSLLGWIAATLVLAKLLPSLRPPGYPPPALPWMVWMPLAVMAAWVLAGVGFLEYWRRRGWRFPLGIAGLGLAASAGLAIVLAAAQLLPVIEFTRQMARAGTEGWHDIYPFSIEPFRLVELVWPNVWGIHFEGNTYWRDALKLPGTPPGIWAPSLYLGGLTLVLARGALSPRQGPPWRIWLSVVVVVSLLGSLGQYTSPIWAARIAAQASPSPPLLDLIHDIGPLDTIPAAPIRLDRFLRDGDGSFYWWLTVVLPGFRLFRFPAKLFTFTALGLAGLAGLGWDGLRAGRVGTVTTWLSSVVLLSLAALVGVWIERPALLTVFRSVEAHSVFGPFDAQGGFRALVRSLVQASIVSGLGLVVVRNIRGRPRWAGSCALLLATADLAIANARYVLTVPQAVLESKPEVSRIIEDAERAKPRAGPFRIHRMPAWHPPAWQSKPSVDRVTDIAVWERGTLQPKYGINLGLEYTLTFGAGEIYDYVWLFRTSPLIIRDPRAAKALGVEVGKEIVYFPRRSFDMWNARYFVIPSYPRGWRDEYRGYASFLFDTEPIHPKPQAPPGPNGAAPIKNQADDQDFQVLRNLNEFPRAWVVHQARWLDPLAGPRRDSGGGGATTEIIYADDPLWHNPTLQVFNPRALAWVNQDKQAELDPYLSGRPPRPTETVHVKYPTPQRAELDASLESPGLVVLADVSYPGWELTIDGMPAQIYPVNGLMRGAAVPAGTHRLAYSYSPRSFLLGRVGSILGLGLLAVLGFACVRWPVDPVLRESAEHDLGQPRLSVGGGKSSFGGGY
jgi:hypothetical protein